MEMLTKKVKAGIVGTQLFTQRPFPLAVSPPCFVTEVPGNFKYFLFLLSATPMPPANAH